MEFEELEDQLRSEGAPLPPALRNRVLPLCYDELNKRQRRHRRFDLRLSGAFAGLCLFYWLAIAALDAQRAALLTPNQGKSDIVLVAGATNSGRADLEDAMKSHSQVLATLLNGNGAWYGEEVDYVAGSTATINRTPANAQSG